MPSENEKPSNPSWVTKIPPKQKPVPYNPYAQVNLPPKKLEDYTTAEAEKLIDQMAQEVEQDLENNPTAYQPTYTIIDPHAIPTLSPPLPHPLDPPAGHHNPLGLGIGHPAPNQDVPVQEAHQAAYGANPAGKISQSEADIALKSYEKWHAEQQAKKKPDFNELVTKLKTTYGVDPSKPLLPPEKIMMDVEVPTSISQGWTTTTVEPMNCLDGQEDTNYFSSSALDKWQKASMAELLQSKYLWIKIHPHHCRPMPGDVIVFNEEGVKFHSAGPSYMGNNVSSKQGQIDVFDWNAGNIIFRYNFFVIPGWGNWVKDFHERVGFSDPAVIFNGSSFVNEIRIFREQNDRSSHIQMWRWCRINSFGTPAIDAKAVSGCLKGMRRYAFEMMSVHAEPLPLP